MKQVKKRMGSLLLSICMVFTMLPAVTFAAAIEISDFDALAGNVALQTVPNGTLESSLNLPDTLEVTTTSSSAYTVNVWGWGSSPSYDGDVAGNYVFTPTLELPSDVTLGSGVTPPSITVSVTVLAVSSSTYTFDSLEEGYGGASYLAYAEPKTFTITNQGVMALSRVQLYIDSSADWLDCVGVNLIDLDPNTSADFTIQPKGSLSAGIYTATIAVKENATLLASIPVSLTVIETVPRVAFEASGARKADTDFSGTGYSWDATAKTLTLTSDYAAGSIEFLDFDSEMKLQLDGDVTIDATASGINCINSDTGSLTIDLAGHTLTLIGNIALSGDIEITIQNGTLVTNQQGTLNADALISVKNLTVENATVRVHAENIGIEIILGGFLTLKQGAKIHTDGSVGLVLNSSPLNLESDDIALTASGSLEAIGTGTDPLEMDFSYAPSSTLKSWSNTDPKEPSPAGEGILLSSKTNDAWNNLWNTSKYIYIGTESLGTTTVSTPTELKTALESTSASTINVAADITFIEKITQRADHTLVIPAGKTVTGDASLGYISIGNHTLTIDGGGTFVCNRNGNTLYGVEGVLNLEDITIQVTGGSGGIFVKTVNLNSGAAVNLNSTGNQLIRLDDACTLNINAGSALIITDFNNEAIVNNGGTLHINGGMFTVGKGHGNDQVGISMNSGLFQYSSGTFNIMDGVAIIFSNIAFVEGVSGKFIDGGYTLSNNGKIAIGAEDAVPSTEGLTIGHYQWNDSKNAFEKQRIIIETQPQDLTVTQGAITETLSVTASVSNGEPIGYQWYLGANLIHGATNATYALPTDLTAGTYKYYCMMGVSGFLDIGTRTATVTVHPVGGAPTYAVTLTNGTASSSAATAGTTVTITADTAPSGQRFKAWTIQSGGIALVNAQASSTSFTMPANAVEVTATYEAIPSGVTPVTGIALDKTALSLYSNTSTKTANLIATLTPADATDKSVTWLSSETSVATVDASGLITAVGNGTTNITVTTTDGGHTASCTVTVATYTSGGSSSDDDSPSSGGTSSGGGSPSGGSTPSGSSSASDGITLKENQPNQPVTAVSSVTATAGTNGVASASITDSAIADAISKAQAEATKQSKTEDGISIGLNVTMPQGSKTLTATLSQTALGRLVSAGVTQLELNGSPVAVSFDQKALTEIQKQASGNVSITITPQTELSETARALFGTRPVYNITVSYGDNSSVSSFGEGGATIAIPYTPVKGEAVSGLYAVYVDENGLTTRVEGSTYDASSGSVLFTTPHFSLYGIAYTAPSEKLKDIDNHWGKASIVYVVDQEILPGIAESTFAPDTATAREMLVTALGKLVKVDVSLYTTSSFTDVKVGSTYQPYIEWAYKSDIIHGIGNSEFAPNRAITREEIAVIIANFTRATGYTLPALGDEAPYADASSIGEPYKAAVTAMQKADIMTGGTDNKFNPKSNATRAEVASMLHRFVKGIID